MSNELAGLLVPATGFWPMQCDIADWGRNDCAEGGRPPEPTLLEKELLETLRTEAAEGGREEVEDEKDVCREIPAIDVVLTAVLKGLELGGAGAGLVGSPARS